MYLQMDGVDDYIQLPTMTIKKIVFEAIFPLPAQDLKMILDARDGLGNGYVYARIDGTLTNAGAVFSETNFSFDKRVVSDFISRSEFTDNVTIFASKIYGENFKGTIYNIKCFNEVGTLVAHYDMNTGTVEDQSGNGNHATLNGGTWVEETYLNFNGVDSFLQTPVLSFDTIEIDFVPRPGTGAGSIETFIDSRDSIPTSTFQMIRSSGSCRFGWWDRVYANGLTISYAENLPFNNRYLLRLESDEIGVDSMSFFDHYSESINQFEIAEGDLYSIKIYYGGQVIAHYDMNTGTVDDQSGNGNHATLVGGMWVGGATPSPIQDAGTIDLTSESNLTTTVNRIVDNITDLTSQTTLELQPVKVTNTLSELAAASTVDVIPIRILRGSATLLGGTTLTVDGQKISPELLINLAVQSTLNVKPVRLVDNEIGLSEKTGLVANAIRVLETLVDLSSNTNLTIISEKITTDIVINLSTVSNLVTDPTKLLTNNISISASTGLTIRTHLVHHSTINLQAEAEVAVLIGEEIISRVRIQGNQQDIERIIGIFNTREHLNGLKNKRLNLKGERL